LPKKKQSRLTAASLISIIVLGVATLLISTFYTSSFLAILGFCLIFWGAILLYTTPTKHVFFDLLSAAAEPSSANIERILKEYGLNQKGVYLPPTSSNVGLSNRWSPLQDSESSLVFIPETSNLSLPNHAENLEGSEKNRNKGVYLTPPGQALCKIFELQADTSFTRIDFRQFRRILPKILKELELAETVDIRTEENMITVEVKRSILDQICKETNIHPQTHKQVGCLLSSSIACALVKVVGEPITIQNENRDPLTKTIEIQYQILTKKEE
jgi:hypothetical protein